MTRYDCLCDNPDRSKPTAHPVLGIAASSPRAAAREAVRQYRQRSGGNVPIQVDVFRSDNGADVGRFEREDY